MRLEQQVCSLEHAKKLKELGVPRESCFYWVNQYDRKLGWTGFIIQKSCNKALLCDRGDELFGEPIIYSAFTVAEIGELLWKAFEQCGWEKFFFVYGEVFGFKGTSFVGELGIVNFMRNPNMGAKMLVYLLENNLIDLQSVRN